MIKPDSEERQRRDSIPVSFSIEIYTEDRIAEFAEGEKELEQFLESLNQESLDSDDSLTPTLSGSSTTEQKTGN